MTTTPKQCAYQFAPDVQCQMEAQHEEPYYPYLDYGQWWEYSAILSRGTAHQVHADPPQLLPRDEWTGQEPKDGKRTRPVFYVRDAVTDPPPAAEATTVHSPNGASS